MSAVLLVRSPEALTSREHDLLVVGGGIYGAMIAWDASQRGLTVGLLEAKDFGGQTSWASLRTIHGGLRHLQGLQMLKARESMRERRALLRIAPAIVRPLSFALPAGFVRRGIFRCGLVLYDLLSPDRNRGLDREHRVPHGRALSPSDLRTSFPALKGSLAGIAWTDAQLTHPERLIVSVLREAQAAGAQIANYLRAEGFLRKGRRVSGVVARDSESGRTLEIPARFVVNAAGPDVNSVLESVGVRPSSRSLVRGVNLVLRRPLAGDTALALRSEGRYLFLVPLQGRSVVGTGYAPQSQDPVSLGEAFFSEAQATFDFLELKRDDVDFVHLGLLPGSGNHLADNELLLDHESRDGIEGLLSVQGVKYTTARGVAERVVNRVFQRLRKRSPPCRTSVTLLKDARPLEGTLEERALASLGEMALHLDDALLRRLFSERRASPEEVEVVLGTMGRALGWTTARAGEERGRWLNSSPPFSEG